MKQAFLTKSCTEADVSKQHHQGQFNVETAAYKLPYGYLQRITVRLPKITTRHYKGESYVHAST